MGRLAAFLAWVSLTLLRLPALIVHENVASFPVRMLEFFFGAFYFIESVVLEGVQLGWPTSRTRRWTVLRHKVKTNAFRTPLNVFTSLFSRPPSFSWKAFLMAGAAELDDELAWSTARKASCAYGKALIWNGDMDVFYDSLTTSEQKIVMEYRSQAVGPSVCSLKQSPFTRVSGDNFAHFTRGDTLHAITKNVALQWAMLGDSSHAGRWLTPREVLLAQCFPVFKGLNGYSCTSFSIPRADRNRHNMLAQAGNSMPLSMSGLLHLYSVIGVDRGVSFFRVLSSGKLVKRSISDQIADADEQGRVRRRVQ